MQRGCDAPAALGLLSPLADLLKADAVKRGLGDPVKALGAFLDGDEQAALEHLGNPCDSLATGRFTAIVLMDHLPAQLRDLILFMNENSVFGILAVELEYYSHAGTEVAYPKLFGAETRGPLKSKAAATPKVDPEQYLAEYADRHGKDSVTRWRELVDALREVPGLTVGHLPAGCPYLYLQGTLHGDVRVFRLAHVAAELRDLLQKPDLFEASAELEHARAAFRQALLDRLPGAYIGGGIGRVYVPLAAAAQHRAALWGEINRLNAVLR